MSQSKRQSCLVVGGGGWEGGLFGLWVMLYSYVGVEEDPVEREGVAWGPGFTGGWCLEYG